MQPDVIKPGTNEYFQLKVAAQIFEEESNDVKVSVDETFFDAGQGWKWTTLIAENLKTGSTFQCLNPKEWEDIIIGATNAEIRGIVKKNVAEYPRLWNIDKIKSYRCPNCQNLTLYNTEKDIYKNADVDYKDRFICEECGGEFEAYPQYDGNILFKELREE